MHEIEFSFTLQFLSEIQTLPGQKKPQKRG